MLTVKEAVNSAIKFFQDLYTGSYSNLSLEEVEMTEDQEFWIVTVGFTPPSTGIQAINGVKREYKIIKIDAESGDFINMKIRKSYD